MSQTETPVLVAALRLAATSRPVFPCQPGGKAPAGELVARGLKDATTSPDQIRKWFTALPGANLALRTGAVSRVVVLDVDGDEGAESLRALEREFGALPATKSVKTPSGGSHFYFRHPGGAGSKQRRTARRAPRRSRRWRICAGATERYRRAPIHPGRRRRAGAIAGVAA
jgi:hypothetical protein